MQIEDEDEDGGRKIEWKISLMNQLQEVEGVTTSVTRGSEGYIFSAKDAEKNFQDEADSSVPRTN